jgi:putative chitinase
MKPTGTITFSDHVRVFVINHDGSRVYANRMGNGDEASGDGFKFRGRGYIQLTGKNNYTSFSTFVGEDCVANPDLVATKYPLASAAFYFNSNKIWAICDKGASDGVVTQVTKAVNGGTHGLPQRIQNFKKFMQALG